MVLFGAPLRSPWKLRYIEQPDALLRCKRACALNEAWRSEGIPQLNAHWPASRHGNRREFGSAQRSDYTAIGPVEPASRVETVAKPGTIFLIEAVHLISVSYPPGQQGSMNSKV